MYIKETIYEIDTTINYITKNRCIKWMVIF